MAVRGGFVVGTCSFSCQDIIDASQDIVMQVLTNKWRAYAKKVEKLSNKLINKNAIKIILYMFTHIFYA